MILLTVDEIIELHTKLMARTGGSDGLRDLGLLESAVYSAQTSFGDEELYPTTSEKAARLMYALVSNHAFVDGNNTQPYMINWLRPFGRSHSFLDESNI